MIYLAISEEGYPSMATSDRDQFVFWLRGIPERYRDKFSYWTFEDGDYYSRRRLKWLEF